MTLRIPKQIIRRWEGPRPDGSIDGRGLAKFLELLCAHIERVHGETADSIAGDKNDMIEIVSRGPGATVRVPIPKGMLERRPDAYIVVHQDGEGAVSPAGVGKGLTDGKNVVVKTSAEKGTTFRAIIYRSTPLSGK